MIQEKQQGNALGSAAPNVFNSGPVEVSSPQSAFMSSIPSTFESPFTKPAVVAPSFPQPRTFEDPAPAFSFAMNQNHVNNVSGNLPVGPPPQTFPNSNQVSGGQMIFNASASPATVTLDSNENTIYSRLTDLTESELCSFQANTFKFGQVPLKPPPKELCIHDGDNHL